MSASQIALYGAIAVVATAGVWKGSSLLERASDRLSTYYGLPAVVQGAVVAAVGSSFPELSAAVLSTLLHGEFDLGVSAIVGSAVFNILVIPALSGFFSQDDLEADRTLVYKEAQFYMLAVAGLLITFALAVIYNPTAPGSLVGTVTRPLALAPLGLYVLYVFIQYQDVVEHEPTAATDGIDVVREWAVLAVSLVVIVIAVEGLVQAAIGFGDLFNTPSFIWGLTVVAAGTSLPDAFVSVQAAKRDEGVISLANVLGSNTFDLLVAVPAGVLVAGTAPIDFAATVPMMAFLTVATLVLFTVLRTDLTLTGREGAVLMGVYAVFVGWLVLETVGVLGFIPGV